LCAAGIDRGAQATARGAARFASQVLDRDAQADARGDARRESQVLLDRGAQAVARGTAARFAPVKGKYYRLYLRSG
jgi:hypothetical protein